MYTRRKISKSDFNTSLVSPQRVLLKEYYYKVDRWTGSNITPGNVFS